MKTTKNKNRANIKTDKSLNKYSSDSFFKDKVEEAKQFFKKHELPAHFKKTTHKRIKAA